MGFLNSVSFSSKLIKSKDGVVGTSDFSRSPGDNLDYVWHLKWGEEVLWD